MRTTDPRASTTQTSPAARRVSLRSPVTAALAALSAAVAFGSASTAVHAPARAQDPYQGLAQFQPPEGSFPASWIGGVDCASERPIQVHEYGNGVFILRQSKCTTFEAPFLYLIFGEERALLLDSGATGTPIVADTVLELVADWKRAHGLPNLELVVAHTHSHGDHVAGDSQFAGKPGVQVVGTSQSALLAFWGFQDWPNDEVTLDLGERLLRVLAIPGHQTQSIAVWDEHTRLLFTGDTVYPGHVFVFSSSQWPIFRTSLQRLTEFVASHPVSWVLGAHVEMTSTPFVVYPYPTSVQPNEHVLQLPPSIVAEMYDAVREMGTTPQCELLADLVIHPTFVCGIGFTGAPSAPGAPVPAPKRP